MLEFIQVSLLFAVLNILQHERYALLVETFAALYTIPKLRSRFRSRILNQLETGALYV
jgi:hypothetical protein